MFFCTEHVMWYIKYKGKVPCVPYTDEHIHIELIYLFAQPAGICR